MYIYIYYVYDIYLVCVVFLSQHLLRSTQKDGASLHASPGEISSAPSEKPQPMSTSAVIAGLGEV